MGVPATSDADTCRNEKMIWDGEPDEPTSIRTWRSAGYCNRRPALHIVRVHCIKCEHVQLMRWCQEYLWANEYELGEQRRVGYPMPLLWCRHCEQFGEELQVMT